MATKLVSQENKLYSIRVILFSNHFFAGATTSADIKKKITKQNAATYIGIGGTYGRLVDTVSKDKIIESDHFPPKSTYPHAKDKNIREIKERDMAACSVSYFEHRSLLTTGSGNEKGGYMNNWLADHFKLGQYYQAVDMNIQIYKEHKILDICKKGVMDALLVHEKNKLITDAQRLDLIKKYSLDTYDKKFESGTDREEAVKVVQA